MKSVLSFLTVLSFLLLASAARAGEFPMATVDYQADQIMHVKSSDGQMNMKGKIYHSGKKERREHTVQGHHGIMILRMDKQLTWMLIPEQKMYMEHSLAEPTSEKNRKDASVDWTTAQDVQMKKLGTETVGGFACTKYQVTVKERDGSTGGGTLWLTNEHNIAIKMKGTSHSGGEAVEMDMELKNLKIGKVDAGLFEIPAGYSKMTMPQMPMGMPGKAMGKGQGKNRGGMGPGMGQGMGMPEGMPGPDATPEEMEAFRKKMMEQAEQMQKQMQEQYGQ